ncbi:GNAT family N-acetyltransferase [Rhodococcus sp. B50]|uniref:GNAT family N-acetyltransferase n=1 Tax=Rhodococcus sp. B50 TaxID=2682847 RepID=UPI001BD36563|nr:GNAT family N-acetyltransferase [Rhodococcus sp. B50]MBS9371452.1 Acetyltransferase [Rhodococcus sp. B50]
MNGQHTVEVERLEPLESDVIAVTDLLNAVYAVAEDGMWVPGTTRTDPDEITRYAREGSIRIARSHGQVVGCIRVTPVDGTTAEFGMLASDPKVRGTGVGRLLIDAVESECAEQGFETMQLEVIRPRDTSHESKVFLDRLYTGLGYVPEEPTPLDTRHPELVSALAVPCETVVYRKSLSS